MLQLYPAAPVVTVAISLQAHALQIIVNLKLVQRQDNVFTDRNALRIRIRKNVSVSRTDRNSKHQ